MSQKNPKPPAPSSQPQSPISHLRVTKIGLSPDGLNAAKGLFILFIVLGHNTLLNESFPNLNRFLYYFHVHVFFLLSALLPTSVWSPRWCADRLVRYGVPYLVFVLFSWVVYHAAFTGGGLAGLISSVDALGLALLSGTGDALKQATGFKFFWFVPAFIVFVNLRALMKRSRILLFLVGAAALVPLVYGWQLPGWIRMGNPWGVYIALWILPFTWIVNGILPRLENVPFRLRVIAFGAAFLLLQAAVILLDLHRLALSSFALPPLWNPPWFTSTLLLVPCAFFFFLHLSKYLRNSRFLKFAGAQSLVIYLAHGFFQIPAVLVAEKLLARLPASPALTFTFMLGSFAVAVTGSLAVSCSLERVPAIRKRLFPKNVKALTGR